MDWYYYFYQVEDEEERSKTNRRLKLFIDELLNSKIRFNLVTYKGKNNKITSYRIRVRSEDKTVKVGTKLSEIYYHG